MTTTAIAPVAPTEAAAVARREAGLRSLSAEARRIVAAEPRHGSPLQPSDRRRLMVLASFDRPGRPGRGPGLVLRPRARV
jgi:hypothetical protein